MSSNVVQAIYAVLDAHGWQPDARPGRWRLPGTCWRVTVGWEWTSLYWLRAAAAETMQRWHTQDINTIGARIAELSLYQQRKQAGR